MDDEKRLSAAQKTLGEPFYGDLSPETAKTRLRLLTFSLIALVLNWGGLSVSHSDGAALLGVRLLGLNDILVGQMLFVTIAYLFIHFGWYAADGIVEWRLRLTANKTMFQTGSTWGHSDADYPTEPRQSTLYNWWRQQGPLIGDVGARMETIEKRIAELEEQLRVAPVGDPNYSKIVSLLASVRDETVQMKNRSSEIEKALNSIRIPASLKRFDDWFKYAARSQSLRWFVFDLAAPLVLGAIALASLLPYWLGPLSRVAKYLGGTN